MELNPDCIRDVLITVKNNDTVLFANNILPELEEYSFDDIMYSVRQCGESDFFSSYKRYVDGGYGVFGLSPKGHEFLDKIESATIWDKLKPAFKNVAIYTITKLIDIVLSQKS